MVPAVVGEEGMAEPITPTIPYKMGAAGVVDVARRFQTNKPPRLAHSHIINFSSALDSCVQKTRCFPIARDRISSNRDVY